VLHGRIPLVLALPALVLCGLVGIGLARLVDLAETWGGRMLTRISIRSAGLAAKA
jgi:hypothetical protein